MHELLYNSEHACIVILALRSFFLFSETVMIKMFFKELRGFRNMSVLIDDYRKFYFFYPLIYVLGSPGKCYVFMRLYIENVQLYIVH